MQGTRYYRLQQVDIDGTTAYFGPVVVALKNVGTLAFYPNPFREQLMVIIEATVKGKAIISVTSPMGRPVLRQTLLLEKGQNTAEILLDPSLPAGMYLISTQLGGEIKHFKLLKR